MVVDISKAQNKAPICTEVGGGVPPLSAYCLRGAELTEPELLLALRWLALPFKLRQASLNHVERRRHDDR